MTVTARVLPHLQTRAPGSPQSVSGLLRDPCYSECHAGAQRDCQPAQQRVTLSQEHLRIALGPRKHQAGPPLATTPLTLAGLQEG